MCSSVSATAWPGTHDGVPVPARPARWLAWLAIGTAVLVWLSTITGTYVVFPLYRVPPPEGVPSLEAYPRALLMANPDTRWLHSFAMEVKEHVPWGASILTTAVAFVASRCRTTLLADRSLRTMAMVLTTGALVLVSFVALMGVFVNKVAPVE